MISNQGLVAGTLQAGSSAWELHPAAGSHTLLVACRPVTVSQQRQFRREGATHIHVFLAVPASISNSAIIQPCRSAFPLFIHVRIVLDCSTGMTFTPDLYRCGISFSGIANLADFARTMPPYWAPIKQRWLRRVGDVTADAALNRRLSPVFHASKIKAPLLIGQGGNDVRVTQVCAGGTCHQASGYSTAC